MSKLNIVKELNPDFAMALAKGEHWALERGFQIEALDHPTRKHPERAENEDGEPHRHCSGCPFPEGCKVCDLD